MKSKIFRVTVALIAFAAIIFFMTGWISAVMSDFDADSSHPSVAVTAPSVDSVSQPQPSAAAIPPTQQAESSAQPVSESPAQPTAEPPAQLAVKPAEPAVQAVAATRTVYVYRDYNDNANKFTQPAWMGSDYKNIPPMYHRAEGIDGSTGIEATVNFAHHTWGGYFFTVPVFDKGADRPRPCYGNDNVGIDLSGAQKLTFHARGLEGGELVEFFTAGLGEGSTCKYPDSSRKISLGYVRLTAEWKKYEINLSGRNLSRIACGFGWVSNREQNAGKTKISFRFDEVRFEFAENL
ncbi:MAG: hypothetical protein LBS42_01390 [Tannerella sp.]|jgi:hypothetical protein|nr:hypothetical protein [Tannerella sp.]